MGVPISGGSYGDSGTRVNGYILPPPTDYHHPVYYNSYNTGDMYVEIMSERTIGEKTVVEKWGCIPIPGGSESGGKGNGGLYGDWCRDGGRGAEGRCGIVEETNN